MTNQAVTNVYQFYHIGNYVRLWVTEPGWYHLSMPAGHTLTLTTTQDYQGNNYVHFIADLVGFYQLNVPGGEPIRFEVKP